MNLLPCHRPELNCLLLFFQIELGLQPGMTLLDIGCGWGATMLRAIEKHNVNVIGLTLSHNQKKHIERLFAESDSPRGKRVLLQSWEEFDEPVDRIVSIGAFEHWGFERYDAFFKMTYDLMPRDGVMLLHTIVIPSEKEIQDRQLPTMMSVMRSSSSSSPRSFPAVGCRRSRWSRSTPPRSGSM